jgi:hypothetical protein
VEERNFRFAQQLDADGLVGRILSISFIAAAPDERRSELERQLREVADAQGGTFDFPYTTSVYVSRAV